MPPRGRRNPALLEPVRTRAEQGFTPIYVANGRDLKFGEYELPAGVEVPGAIDWPRVEAWVNARRIRQLRVDEPYTTFEDFKAKVDAERLAAAEALEVQAMLEAEREQQAAKAAEASAEDSSEKE